MGHGSSPDLGAWAGGAGSAVTPEIPLMGAQLLFITCTAKSQVGQWLVPEVPDAWAPLAGDGEEGDRRAVEEEVFFSLWLKGGKESCPAQQCYCSATPGEGGGMLGAGTTQRRVGMLQGMAGTGNITLTTGPHAFSCYADLGAAWHWCAAPGCSLSPSGCCKGGGWWGSLAPACTLWKVGRAWLQDPDVSAQVPSSWCGWSDPAVGWWMGAVPLGCRLWCRLSSPSCG